MNDFVQFADGIASQSKSGKRLENKSIILTGAAGSIGRFITRQLLCEGARVMMTGRDISKLEEFVDSLCDDGFDRENMVVTVGDCADPEVCRRIVAETVEAFGAIDVLVNNAGAAGPQVHAERYSFFRCRNESCRVGSNHVRLCHESIGRTLEYGTRRSTPHVSGRIDY